MKYKLSFLIPARNEEWLSRTVEDILVNTSDETEVIVGLDGQWANPPVKQHPRVTIFYSPVSLGQRAMTNQLARLSTAKYVCKVDAHCAFDKDWDIKMFKGFEELGDDVTMVSTMRNLHVFDWVCPDGHRRYQGPSGVCKECGKETTKDILWFPKPSPQSTSYRFDKTLHFQYFGEYKEKQIGDLVESMSLQGSCFMLTREKYWELNICDETWGSWGQQGTEVSCKTWLSGGRVIVNKRTWYAHLFRTQGGDFSFPYPNPEDAIEKARQKSRDIFLNDKYEKAVRPFQWIIDKFNPPDWNVTKGVIYYTDSELDENIAQRCQQNLRDAFHGKLVSVSLKPLDFGDKNIVLNEQRGYLTMAKQILAGLEAIDTDYVFFCEHDVLYHPSHFQFTPPTKDKYYYNMNVWIVRTSDGFAVTYDHKSLSGLCADRKLLVKHYKERIKRIEKDGFSRKMGFEPGTHNRPERIDDIKASGWKSEYPNLDLKHGKNLTQARWKQEDFRDKNNCKNWKESKTEIEGWGNLNDII